MRKLYFLLLLTLFVSATNASAETNSANKITFYLGKAVSGKTPVGFMVQSFFRKIFTGKEQMSERKRKRILARQK